MTQANIHANVEPSQVYLCGTWSGGVHPDSCIKQIHICKRQQGFHTFHKKVIETRAYKSVYHIIL